MTDRYFHETYEGQRVMGGPEPVTIILQDDAPGYVFLTWFGPTRYTSLSIAEARRLARDLTALVAEQTTDDAP